MVPDTECYHCTCRNLAFTVGLYRGGFVRSMANHSFADLFAGCGGLSLGFAQAGLQGRFAIERDPMAFETFATNFLSGYGAHNFVWPNWLEQRAWDIDELLAKHSDR